MRKKLLAWLILSVVSSLLFAGNEKELLDYYELRMKEDTGEVYLKVMLDGNEDLYIYYDDNPSFFNRVYGIVNGNMNRTYNWRPYLSQSKSVGSHESKTTFYKEDLGYNHKHQWGPNKHEDYFYIRYFVWSSTEYYTGLYSTATNVFQNQQYELEMDTQYDPDRNQKLIISVSEDFYQLRLCEVHTNLTNYYGYALPDSEKYGVNPVKDYSMVQTLRTNDYSILGKDIAKSLKVAGQELTVDAFTFKQYENNVFL